MNHYIIKLGLLAITLLVGCAKDPMQTEVAVKADQNGAYVPVTIGDTTIMMLWDTGADATVLSEEFALALGVKYDTNEKNSVSTFSLNIDTVARSVYKTYFDPHTTINAYVSNELNIQIGNLPISHKLYIVPYLTKPAILGSDIINKFYWAMHLTDQRFVLSNTPQSFGNYDIVEKLELQQCDNTDIYNVKIENDTLMLVFDSGMIRYDQVEDNPRAYYDIMLKAKDSMGVASKVFKAILKRARVKISQYDFGEVFTTVYDSVFTIGSHQMISYIPYRVNDAFDQDYNGYITYGFIARFDIVYYDPRRKTMTFYKIRDYKSIMQDVPIWEYAQGSRIERE